MEKYSIKHPIGAYFSLSASLDIGEIRVAYRLLGHNDSGDIEEYYSRDLSLRPDTPVHNINNSNTGGTNIFPLSHTSLHGSMLSVLYLNTGISDGNLVFDIAVMDTTGKLLEDKCKSTSMSLPVGTGMSFVVTFECSG